MCAYRITQNTSFPWYQKSFLFSGFIIETQVVNIRICLLFFGCLYTGLTFISYFSFVAMFRVMSPFVINVPTSWFLTQSGLFKLWLAH